MKLLSRLLAGATLMISFGGAATAQAPSSGANLERFSWEKTVPVIAEGPWTGKRLADGQPDIQGFWSNTISNHSNWTDPQAGPPGEPSSAASLPRDQRAPSRVSDPGDGQVPYLPRARALQKDFEQNFDDPVKPKYIEPLARCAPGGVPKSFMWHGYEIRQFPGFVLFLFDSGSRLIHLDDKPHLPENVKLWNADSRGRWEGNTLVVSVRNSNGKALFGRTGDFATENATIEERYVFDPGGLRYNYIARFTDPAIYSRPWTATIPAKRFTEADPVDGWHYNVTRANRTDGKIENEHIERICVENNGPFGGGAVGVPLDAPVIGR